MIHFLVRMTDILNNPEHSREDFTMSDTGEQGVSFQVGVSSKSFHWSVDQFLQCHLISQLNFQLI